MTKPGKSWEKRLHSRPDPLMVDFVQSLSVDKRLYKYDIAGSIAHAQMLAGQKLITAAEFKKIKSALLEIEREVTTGRLKLSKHLEDIHMVIEDRLISKIGDVGKKLHTGRSRNDQVATDMRLWVRDQVQSLQDKITLLQKAFVSLAADYTGAVMPGFTHLQRAQPVVIAAYLLSFVEQFERDFIRLGNCGRLLNACPLGSGAVAGSTLALDRQATARLLGFSEICRNSIDAVGDRDFCAEFIFDCALIAAHLSRLAEDWIIYSTTEFGFVSIDDGFCTSSSMMPQKRNPDVLELVRAKAAGVYGSLMAMLTILKAQPTGYNRDLQEDKVHVFSTADTVESSLDIAAAIVANTKFNTKRISAGLNEGFLDATALAEYLVAKGVPFRDAHGIVGSLVGECDVAGRKLKDVSLDEFKRHCAAIEADVYESIGPESVVAEYVTDGAAGTTQAQQQIKYWNDKLAKR
ncbi:MAG TPA: argininosuccinate lyase [Sedimentisphaerales bacterium]|nr:argininosuccinate lyase [Sedimentisphaerales bacterium]